MAPTTSLAIDYKYKKSADFKPLDSFASTAEFETYYGKYINDCYANTYGGTGGIPCAIETEIWDKELNIQYQKLMAILHPEAKQLLLESQRAWLKERDSTYKLTAKIASLETKDTSGKFREGVGTMNYLIETAMADELAFSVNRDRALHLKLLATKYKLIIESKEEQ